MKITTKLVAITIVVVSILLLSGYFIFDAFTSAKSEWLRICKRIESNQVLESKALINDEVYSIDVGCLAKDDFIIWHPKGRSTPTPYYGRIEIMFLDGYEILLYNWETEHFSVYYKNRYYELANEELFLRLKELSKGNSENGSQSSSKQPPVSPPEPPSSEQSPALTDESQTAAPIPEPPTLQYFGFAEVFGFDDGWFYYCHPEENGSQYGDGLYRIHADGTGKAKLFERNEIDSPVRLSLTFYDGWMYYTNVADNYTLYKARTDGTEKTKLNDDEFSVVQIISDGWVYYRRNTSADDCTYRIRTDGSDRRILCDFELWIVGVTDGWIFYQEYENDFLCLYKTREDGTETIKVATDANTLLVLDGWIYYLSLLGRYDNRLCRMRTDGTGNTQLDEYAVSSKAFFSDGRIYYKVFLADAVALRSLGIDGSDKLLLDCRDVYYIYAIEDGWIYYQSNPIQFTEGDIGDWYEAQGEIYRMRTDGSDKQEITF